MSSTPSHPHRLGLFITAALLALLLPAAPAAAGSPRAHAAAPASAPSTCPTIMDPDAVHKGQSGVGWTVVEGTTPRRFGVDVLGVLSDGIAPGRDLIIVKVRDLPGSHFIAKAGGIWGGMSGSPVYVGGKLVGSVSYGFTVGPSPIGGVTPAGDMASLLTYGSAASTRRAAGSARIVLPRSLARSVASQAGVSVAQASSLSRLALPLAVSGLTSTARARLQESFDKAGASVLVVPGSAARAPHAGAPSASPVPGGNFAALISYGDVTAGGIGTTTYVCGDMALAFGHPAFFGGKASYGANDADAIAIIKDPTLGAFKMAEIGPVFGVVDQDRLLGIRADTSRSPHLIPVTAHVHSVDLGTSRDGETDVTSSDFVPGIAPSHLYADIVSLEDRQAQGSALLTWTIRGKRPNGDAWQLDRTDRVASGYDVASEAAYMLDDELRQLAGNSYERVRFTSIAIDAKVNSTFAVEVIEHVLVSRNGGPFKEPHLIKVHPGDTLRLHVHVRRYQGAQHNVTLDLVVPADASGDGQLTVVGGGGGGGYGCDEEGSGCPSSFLGIVQALEDAPRSDAIVADLTFYGLDEPGAHVSTSRLDSAVVAGYVQIDVLVP